MKLFGGTIQTLEKSLDYSTAKNRAIADNISNVDTPHYKAKDIRFKDVLDSTMHRSTETKRTHDKHIQFNNREHLNYSIHSRKGTLYNHNGNNVDIDKEMSELAKNQIYYQALVDRINDKFGNIQAVVRGGS